MTKYLGARRRDDERGACNVKDGEGVRHVDGHHGVYTAKNGEGARRVSRGAVVSGGDDSMGALGGSGTAMAQARSLLPLPTAGLNPQ